MRVLIGRLAGATGVSAKTIRFWESQGLLKAPARTSGGYRDYAEGMVTRVEFILAAQRAGLTLRQIGEILTIRDGGQPPCEHTAALVTQRLSDVDQRMAELTHTRTSLIALQRRLMDLEPMDCDGTNICSAIKGTHRISATHTTFQTPPPNSESHTD